MPQRRLFHEPPVTDNKRLTRECIRFEASKENRQFRDVVRRREFTVDCVLEQDLPDDVFFAESEVARPLWDLYFYQRGANEARADHVGSYAMRRSFFCDDTAEAK